ncbi:MAG: META domain-containing protein [Propionibacteriales bacterium]|nr:META domain-containing protein [Propionibacteriales bacterium]
MSLLRVRAVGVLVGSLLVGCGSSGASPDDVDGRAAGRPIEATYVVTGVTRAGTPYALVKGTEIRLAFTRDSVTITAGCNTMSGSYAWDGSRLTVPGLATTEMGCDRARMDQDAWIAGLFAGPVRLSTGNDAAIISGDVVLTLTDREAVSPDRPLQGTRWVLDTLIDEETASSVPAGIEAFLLITGSSISLDDGCNSGSGSVEIAGDVIVVDQTARTQKACQGTETVEGAFTAVLDGAATFRIEEDRLTITHDGRGLGFVAAVDGR